VQQASKYRAASGESSSATVADAITKQNDRSRFQKRPRPFRKVLLISLGLVFSLVVIVVFVGWRSLIHRAVLRQRMISFQLCLWDLMGGVALPENVTCDKTGRPACSWRFACNPCVVSGARVEDIPDVTIPWKSDKLDHWRHKVVSKYCFSGTCETNVMAVIGKGTAFEKGKRFLRQDLPRDLILIIEVRDTGVHWMAPVDLDVAKLGNILSGKESRISLGTRKDGFLVGFVDGEVWLLKRDIPKDVLLKFCSREAAAVNDREKLLSDFRLASMKSKLKYNYSTEGE